LGHIAWGGRVFAEVVNDQFLLGVAERTRRCLETVVEQRERPELNDDNPWASLHAADIDERLLPYFLVEDIDDEPLVDISTEDIQKVIDELGRAYRELDRERDRQSAWMCIPSIPVLAIVQSELTRALEQEPDGFAQLDDDIIESSLAVDIGQMAGEMVVMKAWGRYEVTDPPILSDPRWLWMRVVRAWYKKYKDKVKFGGLPRQPVKIAENARIILVGDWGSGLDRAQDVGRQIRAILDEGLKTSMQQHVIHLGDVYYTGSTREYEKNFLRHWPVKTGEDIGSFIVCGNHDLYRGGHAYYGTALADPRFAKQKHKSVFALRNEYWQFLGLDTAYQDKQISKEQAAWIEGQFDPAHELRTTMLSHHPLWSAYDEHTGEQLRKDLGHLLERGRIDAWFWGHEHRCLVYEPRDGVQFTSCVGHGGIPSYLKAEEGEPLRRGLRHDYRKRHGNGFEPWNTFGFVVIDLAGPHMRVRYIDESGYKHHEESV
jgi:predicted phosphodiesterase